ncbi:MAG: DUF3794 domain-containing protein [Oscillospiraceae bacterium]|nr:DUF3794 domain-containing protein [Oscillospiraceae bacterium]
MLVETAKDQICINQLIGQKREMLEAEGDVIVNDVKPDVLKIISSSGTACVYKKEVLEGKIRLDGSINTYIMYLADDENGSVRSLNTVLDFTKFIDIDNCKPEMILDEQVMVKSFECNILNSRKISVKAHIEMDVKIYSNENIEIISNIEELEHIQVLKKQATISSLMGQGSSRTYAKESIAVDGTDDLAEIMQARVRITGKEAKVSYNKVLVKADLDVDTMYLTEDNRINTVSSKLPIMGFVDIPNVSDDNICDVKCKLKNLIIKPNNGETHSIYIEAEIELVCFVYEEKSIGIIEDLYSISSDLKCRKREVRTMTKKNYQKERCNIKQQLAVPEIGASKIYHIDVKPNIITMQRQSGKVMIEGDAKLEFLFESGNSVNTKDMTIPFTFEVESEMAIDGMELEAHMELTKETFIIISDGNIETDIDLDFSLAFSKDRNLEVLEEIEVEESKENNIYSMVVYFVKPEDSLWKIAKKLKSTMADILRVNELEDGKVRQGQQLYVPKYVSGSTQSA